MAAQWGMMFTVDGRSESAPSLAFQGRLNEVIGQKLARLEKAYPQAMDTGVMKPGKAKLRATIEATGFYRAKAFSTVWRGTTYPRNASTLQPAAQFVSKAKMIIDAFEDGVTIHAGASKFLAVPLGPAKAVVHNLNRGRNRSRTDAGRFAKEASIVPRVAAALGVNLVPRMARDGSKGVMVSDAGTRFTKRGRLAKSQTGEATPLFALVRQATLKPRPMGRAVLAQLKASFVSDFTGALAPMLGSDD